MVAFGQKYPYYIPLIQALTFINDVESRINIMHRDECYFWKKNPGMKVILVSFCLLSSLALKAQVKEGKVTYERTMQIRSIANLPEGVTMPPSRKDNFELQFANNQSTWQAIPNPDGENNTITGPGLVLRMAGNDDITYFNFTDNKRLDQREILEREFLVEDTVAKLSWKLTEETKNILGYNARKATSSRIGTRMQMTMENGAMKREEVGDTSYLTAWFTSEVALPAGPGEWGGQLPGLILELSINNGRTVYTAVQFSAKVNPSKIKEPKGGNRLSAAAFVLEREKLMEEMRKNNPGGNRVIRVN